MGKEHGPSIEHNPAAYVEPGSIAELNHFFEYDQRQAVWQALAQSNLDWKNLDNSDRNKLLYAELERMLDAAKAEHEVSRKAGSPESLPEYLKTFVPMYLMRQKMERASRPAADDGFPDQKKWEDDNAEMIKYLNLSPKEIVERYEAARAKAKANKR